MDQNGIDDAEYGGGGADAQREREDCGECETRTLLKVACSVPKVLPKAAHQRISLAKSNIISTFDGTKWQAFCLLSGSQR